MMLVIQSNADSIVRPTAFHRSKSQLYDRPLRVHEIECFASETTNKTSRSSCNFSNSQFIYVSIFVSLLALFECKSMTFLSRVLEFELDHFETRLILETDIFKNGIHVEQ